MKPDWKDAPEWAMYLAQDESGKWYWYSHKPVQYSSSFMNPDRYDAMAQRAEIVRTNNNWMDTLEARP